MIYIVARDLRQSATSGKWLADQDGGAPLMAER